MTAASSAKTINNETSIVGTSTSTTTTAAIEPSQSNVEVAATSSTTPPPPPPPPSTTATAKSTSSVTSKQSTLPSSWNAALVTSYVTILVLWIVAQQISIDPSVHVLVLVTAILYAACHASLVLLCQNQNATHDTNDPNKNDKDNQNNDGSRHGAAVEREVLRKEDAYFFPIIGSVTLFGLYLAFRFLGKDFVNLLIGIYFGIVGCLAITMTIAPAMEAILLAHRRRRLAKQQAEVAEASAINPNNDDPNNNNDVGPLVLGWEYKINHSLPEWLLGPSPFDLSLEVTPAELSSLIVAATICIVYFYHGKQWYWNNVLAICFCLQGISRFSLGTYKIGAILLIGLFFYDIFWVFGTDVMVTVAKNLDGPIKILFPRSLDVNPITGRLDLSLLGLGDIVIPGFFLALLLRFDAHKAQIPALGNAMDIHIAFPKPYFHTTLFAYVVGLATTLMVMTIFNQAQPALLYLVPACLGSSLACAWIRGEMKDLFEYSEEDEDVEEDEQAAEVNKDELDNDDPDGAHKGDMKGKSGVAKNLQTKKDE